MKNILKLSSEKARTFLLKQESYFNFDLPIYFEFQSLLDKISTKVDGKSLSDFYGEKKDLESGKIKPTYPSDSENVNYKFLNNKDGKFAWRPFQLIHPALYVSLVHKITEKKNWGFIVNRIYEFQKNEKIECFSLPIVSESELSDKAETIINWWESVEQKSIELALEYGYVMHTDVSDCYGSIYTHSIPWALHTKPEAKKKRSDKTLIGNIIDKHLQDMSFGQTNGIPQGSVLMDLIAEMVLGYADLQLTERLKSILIRDYRIIRHRDDYRIFTNNPQDAELILKHITEILIELNMKLNSQKTIVSNDIVESSIKPDKLYWNKMKKSTSNLQNHLLIIHELANKYPNSGSLTKALTKYYNRIHTLEKTNQKINVLISILVDIAYKNPRTYAISAAILSELLVFIETEKDRDKLLEKIINRFQMIPNTGHLQIWLQRVTIKLNRKRKYSEPLCEKVNDEKVEIWNSDWLNEDLKKIISIQSIINEKHIEDLSKAIKPEEVELFESKSDYTYKE